jgi:hypothetical protein
MNSANHTLTLSGFTDGQYVTYHAPAPTTFTPRQVAENYDDPNNKVTANDTIYLPGHSFVTGDLATFTLVGAPTPIPGLTSGNTYYVTRKDANTVQLSAYAKASGITFTRNAGGDTIKWTGGNCTCAGFKAGQQVTISGSTLTGSNNTNNNHTWTLAGISADGTTLTLTVSNTVVAGRCCGLLDLRAQADVPSALRSDTPTLVALAYVTSAGTLASQIAFEGRTAAR